jgi:hypothetical protein
MTRVVQNIKGRQWILTLKEIFFLQNFIMSSEVYTNSITWLEII